MVFLVCWGKVLSALWRIQCVLARSFQNYFLVWFFFKLLLTFPLAAWPVYSSPLFCCVSVTVLTVDSWVAAGWEAPQFPLVSLLCSCSSDLWVLSVDPQLWVHPWVLPHTRSDPCSIYSGDTTESHSQGSGWPLLSVVALRYHLDSILLKYKNWHIHICIFYGTRMLCLYTYVFF